MNKYHVSVPCLYYQSATVLAASEEEAKIKFHELGLTDVTPEFVETFWESDGYETTVELLEKEDVQ